MRQPFTSLAAVVVRTADTYFFELGHDFKQGMFSGGENVLRGFHGARQSRADRPVKVYAGEHGGLFTRLNPPVRGEQNGSLVIGN